MNELVAKTLGGLSKEYYIRQFLFGLALSGIMLFMLMQREGDMPWYIFMLGIVNMFLYPYSRFVYESIVNYIMGDNVFFVNLVVIFFAKIITMIMCLQFAWVIAPFGLAYLYYYHNKEENQQSKKEEI